MQANQSAREKLKALKSSENLVIEEIESPKTSITDLEKNIDEASFAFQHFSHENGHVYDTIAKCSSNVKFNRSSICPWTQIRTYDESFNMPYKWIKIVPKKVDICIRTSKVMTLYTFTHLYIKISLSHDCEKSKSKTSYHFTQ
jgi:hypothetical protein